MILLALLLIISLFRTRYELGRVALVTLDVRHCFFCKILNQLFLFFIKNLV